MRSYCHPGRADHRVQAWREDERSAHDVLVGHFYYLGKPRWFAGNVDSVRIRFKESADWDATHRTAIQRGNNPARGRRVRTQRSEQTPRDRGLTDVSDESGSIRSGDWTRSPHPSFDPLETFLRMLD